MPLVDDVFGGGGGGNSGSGVGVARRVISRVRGMMLPTLSLPLPRWETSYLFPISAEDKY